MRLGDLPILVDHVRDAAGVLVFRRVGGAVRDAELAVGVTEQREGELELLGEGFVLGGGVEADAEDFDVLRFVLRQEVPEPGTLAGSAGCVGLRIEPEDDFLPAQVGEADAVAVVIDDVEVGSGIAGIQHGGLSSCQKLKDSA